jgi:hypothetical protein
MGQDGEHEAAVADNAKNLSPTSYDQWHLSKKSQNLINVSALNKRASRAYDIRVTTAQKPNLREHDSLLKSNVCIQPAHVSCEIPQQCECHGLPKVQDAANEAGYKPESKEQREMG